MRSRSLLIAGLLLALAVPLSASQFLELPFEQVASEAQYIVRGTIGNTWTAWDSDHQVVYTYATVSVSRYFGETTGPDTLVVREVGGTIDGYTQEAIGFPMIRGGEDVVLMLSKWEDSGDLRIHAFNQGKYLVRNRGGVEVLVSDPVHQGDARLAHPRDVRTNAIGQNEIGLTMAEFAQMVNDARGGLRVERPRQ